MPAPRYIPPEFAAACALLHPDLMLDHATVEDAITWAFQASRPADKPAIRAFIDRLLQGPYSTAELKGVLNRALPDWFVIDAKGARALLEHMRRALD